MSQSSPIIIWYRADLRVHDHPALAAAAKTGQPVIPLFIFNEQLVAGKNGSANRNRFLLECLRDLKSSLKKMGADLVVRHGDAATELMNIIEDTQASAVYYTAEYSPFSLRRDRAIEAVLEKNKVTARSFGGKLAVNALQKLQTKSGTPYKVFTPFWKAWMQVKRAPIAATPRHLSFPRIAVGRLPAEETLTQPTLLSRTVSRGGETEARRLLRRFLDGPINEYQTSHNAMGQDGTSRLSPYFHFGCLSVREIETLLPDSAGARSWHRQLAWRDFYYYVLFHFPHPEREFQDRYRGMSWTTSKKLLDAWKEGRTGYPIVDAAMRQLREEGWMHNRGRLIVGSFLTKDLGIDWREGERHFMQWLLDGDMANNNGNWQWIASVGVDPAPLFRRLYNPSSQRDKYDSTGAYTRRYVPELARVPDKYLSEPWTMPDELQKESRCVIGTDYPAPIVDHKEARQAALERYRSA